MAGKVTGIGVIGLLQVVAVLGAAAGKSLALGLLDSRSLDLGATIAWTLVWFVVGFIAYSLALATLASMVSRQEDVASITAPVLVLMDIPCLIGISIARRTRSSWCSATSPSPHPCQADADADSDRARSRGELGDHRVSRALLGRSRGPQEYIRASAL